MAERKLWTREELILALNLYLKLPFGKLDARTEEVIHLADITGRSANSISMRLNNFASVDPYHQKRGIKGLTGGIKQVQPIWDEFINDKEALIFESEQILASKENLSVEKKFADELKEITHLKGEDKQRVIKTRINQNVFRRIVLTNYCSKCAITGIDIPDFLNASHIIPWSKNEKERLNPENGICLSPLYDRAFDKGYITVSGKYKIIISSRLKEREKEDYFKKYFEPLNGLNIFLPQKYLPSKLFLEYHFSEIFKR